MSEPYDPLTALALFHGGDDETVYLVKRATRPLVPAKLVDRQTLLRRAHRMRHQKSAKRFAPTYMDLMIAADDIATELRKGRLQFFRIAGPQQ